MKLLWSPIQGKGGLGRFSTFDGPQALHPLVFTFATAKPVYPLRLTGVDNGPLKVELFVLGPARARIPGFDVVDARPTVYPDPGLDGRVILMAWIGRMVQRAL